MINLAHEVVSTAYDILKATHTYVILRNGRRWTVTVPDGALSGTRENRRQQLIGILERAMCGPADGEAQ